MKKSFEKWLWEDLEEHFGLKSVDSSILKNWIENDEQMSSYIQIIEAN